MANKKSIAAKKAWQARKNRAKNYADFESRFSIMAIFFGSKSCREFAKAELGENYMLLLPECMQKRCAEEPRQNGTYR